MFDIRYAKNGDVHLAYRIEGRGDNEIVLALGTAHPLSLWTEPVCARHFERLASIGRVVAFDQRGLGYSDPVAVTALPTLEERVADIVAVVDSADCARPTLVAFLDGAPPALTMAATRPDRIAGLVLVNGYAWGRPSPEMQAELLAYFDGYGSGTFASLWGAPDDPAQRRIYARIEQAMSTPGLARALMQQAWDTDLYDVLPAVNVPTLVIAGRDALIPVELAREMAARIPLATLVEVDHASLTLWFGNADAVIAEIEEFLTGSRRELPPDRALATVLFTDIVGSTQHASRVGDVDWRRLHDDHDGMVRRQLERFDGHEVKTLGDGFLATFTGPTAAIRAALAIRDGARQLGLRVRCGLHTGEVELRGDDVAGLAVHIAARVGALAQPGEVLVSATVPMLVAGSGVEFGDRGDHALKGVPGTWKLFAVEG